MSARNINSNRESSKNERNWSLFFCGLLICVCGVMIIAWPGLTLVAISEIAGVLLVMAGVFDFVAYFRDRRFGMQTTWTIINGICCLILGLLFLVHPLVTSFVIPFIVGIFVLLYSVICIVSAVSMRSFMPAWGFMLANGIVSLVCGILFIAFPQSFAIYLGIFMIMRGVTMCAFGLSPQRKTIYY